MRVRLARSAARLACALAALVPGAALHAQAIEVRFHVAMVDQRDSYPVQRYTLLVIGARGDSTFVQTDLSGVARASLAPGPYRLARYEGVEFDGVRWTWEIPLAVRDGKPLIELTQRNATYDAVAQARTGTTPVVIAAATMAATKRPTPPQLEERIGRVEHGLAPAILIKGQPRVAMDIAERMAYYGVPGVSIAVINDDRIEWARGYGTRKVSGGPAPVDSGTLFQAASISKPVSAMAALRLVEQGTLALDEDVNAKLVSWKVPENAFTRYAKVTLRGLLTHSAGLTVHGFAGYAYGDPVPTLPQVLDGAPPANSAPIRVDVAPGTLRRYSGGGFTVLQQLMIDVTGKPFPTLMREMVLGPIGMAQSTFENTLPPSRAIVAAMGHRADGVLVPGRWHAYPEMAAAGLWTTPSDLARFALELLRSARGASNRVLSQAMTEQMLTRQKLGWGLGLGVGGENEPARFTHGGANEGYRCLLVAFTVSGKGAVVMTNSDNGGPLADEIIRSIAREYGWPDLLPAERAVAQVDPDVYASLVGRYHMESAAPGVLVNVTHDEHGLRVQTPGGRPEVVYASSDSSYFAPGDGTQFTFLRGEDGAIAQLLISLPGQHVVAARVK